MITYSTNFMGPISPNWYRERGIELGPDYNPEVVWAGGRIDVYGTEDPHGFEINLPIMRGDCWNRFSDWLDQYQTETVKTLDQILQDYYSQGHEPIVWWKDETV